jgi:hypothetical protein
LIKKKKSVAQTIAISSLSHITHNNLKKKNTYIVSYQTLINNTIKQDLRMFPFEVCYELTFFENMMISFAMMMIIFGIFFIMGIVVKIAQNLRETINENTDALRLNATALLVVAEQNQIETAIISENTAVSLVAIIAANTRAHVGTNNIMAENTAATTGLVIVLTAANAIIDDNTDALLGVARNNPVILPVVGDIFPAVSNSIVHLSLSFSSSKVKVYLI